MNTGAALQSVAAPRMMAMGRDMVGVQSSARLAAFVAECVATGVARRVLLVRLSRLPRALARPHHLRLVRTALEPLVSANRAQVFNLESGDVAIAWRGAEDAALARSRRTIEHLFQDAAVLDSGQLLAVMALPEDAEILLTETAGAAQRDRAPVAEMPGWPLDAGVLAVLEQALAQADIARFMRRHPVREPAADGFRLAWERRFLAATEAVGAVMQGVDVAADPWLFLRLTRTFDRRMLALLSATAELRDAGPFAFGLNVTSVLGPEFLRFDAVLPRRLRGHVTLDFTPADVVADLAAFGFARDFARDRGYRVALRGLDAVLAPLLAPDRLGFDLAYIRWSRQACGAPPVFADMAPARIVLSDAGSDEAVAWGKAHGIGQFEAALA